MGECFCLSISVSGILVILLIIFILLIPVVAIGGGIYWLSGYFREKERRGAAVKTYAAENLGFKFLGGIDYRTINGASQYGLFNLGRNDYSRHIKNFMSGAAGGFQASVFEFCYETGNSNRDFSWKAHEQTVVMLESPQIDLPWFTLSPENNGLFRNLGELPDGQDIDFATHPVFSSKYFLRGADEIQIRRLFGDSVLTFFENYSSLNVEGGGNRLFIYRADAKLDPSQFRSAIDEAIRIANVVLT